jgi:hypothetical protein
MQLPGPVRAVVGLVAVAADEAKHLPERAIELPMLAVSTALQMSLRAQQRYARLAARGDDVINRRPGSDEPPAWATFDDPVGLDDARIARLDHPDPARRATAASELLDELLGLSHNGAEPQQPAEAEAAPPPVKKATAARKAPAAKKAPARKATAKKTAGGQAGKSISPPRHSPPSRFDTVDE